MAGFESLTLPRGDEALAKLFENVAIGGPKVEFIDSEELTEGGKRGYICVTCHMDCPPLEPAKADPQMKLEAGV